MGICLQMVCKKSYVSLNAENCMQNVKKNQNFICRFSFIQMERNAYISKSLVYYSVKDLFKHLYESTESYCYHFGLASHFKGLRQSFSTTTARKGITWFE